MQNTNLSSFRPLNLRAGELIEVRSQAEILETLDKNGRLDSLPFMPEMLEYCGRRLRVYKRADKTCDYTQEWSIRRVTDAVHLEDGRCDGSGHSGCEASCLIFWKEAWLKRAASDTVSAENLSKPVTKPAKRSGLCTVEDILAASCVTSPQGEVTYACQATDVTKFTSYMSFWDPRQYIRDLRSGNLDSGHAHSSRGHRILDMVIAVLRLLQSSIIGLFNDVQQKRQGSRYPFIEGTATVTPTERLNLQPGELVQVRSKEEIVATLDKTQRNRGLWFDSEMLPYCGGIYRVLRCVHHIVDEKTGKMISMKNPCIVLHGVVCKSEFHRLCPRAIYPYWREAWLTRATNLPPSHQAEATVETCEKC
jgi:hypothetical protein